MIGEYTLKTLCEKYKLNSEKLVNKNNNILNYGDYQNIDQTLDYLINTLHIDPNNIEKCPSILCKSVNTIQQNVIFLNNQGVVFDNIESCLHVLSTEPNELMETYNYVKFNYNEDIINKITSILSVSKNIIIDVEKLNIPFTNKVGNLSVAVGIGWEFTNIEEIRQVIHSPEFKEHPELFTSTTLAHAKIKEIREMIHSSEFKEHPELFTSTTLARTNIEDVRQMIHSSEFKEHPELFTSDTLAKSNIEEIRKMIHSSEFKEYPELFTSTTLACTHIEDVRQMIHSPEFKEHPELFTSTTLAYARRDTTNDSQS